MSLWVQSIPPIPSATTRIAKTAFPKGNLCLQLRDILGGLYQDSEFIALFSSYGQHAPWQLALTSVLQFAEGLSDYQAADAVRSRIDWKYLVSLELTGCGFDRTVLCEFRSRLLDGRAEAQLLKKKFLEVCASHSLVQSRGRQRTDWFKIT